MDVVAKSSVATEISASPAMKSMIVALEFANHKDLLAIQIARKYVMMIVIDVIVIQTTD
jgi:hypothetical protein